MVRLLVIALAAAVGVQPSPVPADGLPSYAMVRDRLDAARAAGTLAKEQTQLTRAIGRAAPALTDYVSGHAALLAYDRVRAGRLLARSFSAVPSAYVASSLAANVSDMGRQGDCVEWATRGLAVESDREQTFVRAELLTTRSLCYFYLQKYQPQDADAAEALRIATNTGDQRARALALRVRGAHLTNAGKPLDGLAALTEAAAISEARGDARALAIDLFQMAAPYPSKYPFADKVAVLDRALELAVRVRDRQIEGRILGQRGAAFISLQRHGEALRDLVAADAILRETGAIRSRAAAAGNLSFLFRELGDHTRAEEQSRLSMSLYARAESTGFLRNLPELALLALSRGDLADALDYQRQAVAATREVNDVLYLRGALLRLGRIHLLRGEMAAAEPALRESVAMSDASGDNGHRSSSYAGLADLFRLTGRAADAAEAYTTALALGANTSSQAALEITAHHGLGLLRASERRYAEAITHYRVALDRIERTREGSVRTELQLTYFADKHALYVDAIDALVEAHAAAPQAGHLREAFLLAERAKARTLLDAVAARGASADVPATVDAMARALDPAELLIEFIMGVRRSFVLTLDRSGAITAHRLPPRPELERLVTGFRELVDRRPAAQAAVDEATIKGAGEGLYRALLAPALAHVPDAARLIVVGDGLLFYTPFEALAPSSRAPYLGEVREIARAPSASVLAAIRARAPARQAASQFVGFGDPVVDGSFESDDRELVRTLERDGFSFARLPGSRREVTTVARLFGTQASRIYTGKTFTAKAALDELQKPNRIVHFATHAVLDERVPGRSGIVVSDPNGDAGSSILRASDLAGLKIPVDLITLSGCQTGLGRVVDGEGVTGLAWAFSRAGAGALMVTLWNVSDAVSPTMMVAFYRALGAAQSKSAALLTARRELIRGSNPALRHPYYWAGYALVGDPR
jgi:CHAT domain-containing protein/tetratricopeptide (TPR) repeat protein